MTNKINKITNIIIFIAILLLGIYSIKELFSPGYFPMHDDTQPARVWQMTKSINDKQFPVRWVADLGYGYGYPIFNFYAPLAYYFGSIFNLIGFDAITATKIMMGIGMILSGFSMYIFAKELWGKIGGLISSLLYLFAPYHALNLYVRGDIAEMYAYSFMPFLFYAVLRLLNSEKQINTDKGEKSIKFLNLFLSNWKWVALGSLSYAAVITSHNLTALMASMFLFLFIAFNWFVNNKRKFTSLKLIFFTLLLGILISAFYWLPVLSEMQYTNVLSQVGGKADYNLHFVCLNQIWDSPWGFGGSTPGCIDGMSFKLGKIHVLLVISGIILLILNTRKDKKMFNIISSLILLFVLSIFLMLESSKIVWDNLPFMKFFQYPWRFLIMATFSSSLLGGYLISSVKYFSSNNKIVRYAKIALSVLIICLIYLSYSKLFVPQTVNGRTSADYINEFNLKWNISKISDEYLPKNFEKPINEHEIVNKKITVLQGDARVISEAAKTNILTSEIIAGEESVILIRTAPFPAWKLTINKNEYEYKPVKNGMEVKIPKGYLNLRLSFVQTRIEKAANLISISGMLGLITVIIGGLRKYE